MGEVGVGVGVVGGWCCGGRRMGVRSQVAIRHPRHVCSTAGGRLCQRNARRNIIQIKSSREMCVGVTPFERLESY